MLTCVYDSPVAPVEKKHFPGMALFQFASNGV
jgi:hypothetical protein